jgi:hypothetical protein
MKSWWQGRQTTKHGQIKEKTSIILRKRRQQPRVLRLYTQKMRRVPLDEHSMNAYHSTPLVCFLPFIDLHLITLSHVIFDLINSFDTLHLKAGGSKKSNSKRLNFR